MESKPQENLPDKRPLPVYVLPCADQDDEISLIDLWRVIVARRTLILLSVLAALVLASVYLFLAGPLYRAEAHLLPQQQDIQALMIYSPMDHPLRPIREMVNQALNALDAGFDKLYSDMCRDPISLKKLLRAQLMIGST